MCSGEEESRELTACKGQGDHVKGYAGLLKKKKKKTQKAKKLKSKGSVDSCWSAEHFIHADASIS